jgi:hypothetical protein
MVFIISFNSFVNAYYQVLSGAAGQFNEPKYIRSLSRANGLYLNAQYNSLNRVSYSFYGIRPKKVRSVGLRFMTGNGDTNTYIHSIHVYDGCDFVKSFTNLKLSTNGSYFFRVFEIDPKYRNFNYGLNVYITLRAGCKNPTFRICYLRLQTSTTNSIESINSFAEEEEFNPTISEDVLELDRKAFEKIKKEDYIDGSECFSCED